MALDCPRLPIESLCAYRHYCTAQGVDFAVSEIILNEADAEKYPDLQVNAPLSLCFQRVSLL